MDGTAAWPGGFAPAWLGSRGTAFLAARQWSIRKYGSAAPWMAAPSRAHEPLTRQENTHRGRSPAVAAG